MTTRHRRPPSVLLFLCLPPLNAFSDEMLANGDFSRPGQAGENPWNWCVAAEGPFDGLTSPGRGGTGYAAGATSEGQGFRFFLWQQFYVVAFLNHES